METKHIMVAIGTFILGGVLGFLINGQICLREMQHEAIYQRPPHCFQDCKYADKGEMGMNSAHCKKQRGMKFIEKISEELKLNDTQKTQLDSIFAKHIEEVGMERGNPENREKLLNSVRTILDENQKKELDKIIKEKAHGFFKSE